MRPVTDDWLSFDSPPTAPLPQRTLPVPTYLSQGSSSRVVPLPTGLARWHYALSELEGTLSTWSLPTTLARRWLAAAQDLMDQHEGLELYVELDPVASLITVELWDQNGARVYGIDDFLAGPEHAFL
jgi:hypothetical protein